MLTKSLTTLLVAITCLTFPAVGRSQTSDLFSPQSVVNTTVIHKLGDIATQSNAASWYRFRLADTSGMAGYMQALGSMFGGAGASDFYTDGEEITIADTSYLVVYTILPKPIDFTQLYQPKPTPPTPLSMDTPLTPGYLNLRSVSGIVDVQPFNLQVAIDKSSQQATSLNEMFDSARERAEDASGVSNAKQIILGTAMYVQDNNEVFPPMTSEAVFKKAIFTYIKSDAPFLDPTTNTPFMVNTWLSKKALLDLDSPDDIVAIYSEPHADGKRIVGFADSRVQELDQNAWAAAKKVSHIR